MTKLPIKLVTLAGFTLAMLIPPAIPAFAAGGGDAPSSSSPPSDSGKKKKDKKSEMEFLSGYKTAWHTIYDRGDYKTGIDQLRALHRDDQADVANLVGYSYRKLGQYEQSKTWYEAALKADPNHVRTWQYYGLWQIEQGHRDQAEANLQKIGSLCGTTCPEYKSLAEALEIDAKGGHAVY